jgi:hypothetical protein
VRFLTKLFQRNRDARGTKISGAEISQKEKGSFNCLTILINETKNEAPEGCFGRVNPLILSLYKIYGFPVEATSLE